MDNVDLLIKSCAILPMNNRDFIEEGAIAIKDGKLVCVDEAESADRIAARKHIDARGKVAMPGLINAHTHVAMTLFRGLGDDQPLDVWLRKTIWPMEKKLKPSDVYAGAMLGCLEMIKSGTTCFGDMYFHERTIAKAVEESGLRAVLAEGIFDLGNRLVGEVMFRRSIRFAKRFHGFANSRITTMLGPHAAYSCSSRLLKRIAKSADELDIGVHIHLAESSRVPVRQQRNHRLDEVELLNKLGLLSKRMVAAHCVNLSNRDMRVLAERGVNVVHCPVANMKLGVGVAPILELAMSGVNVALGTDGPASNNCLDMFETMKTSALIQKAIGKDPSVLGASEVLKMATVNGAKALGINGIVGSLEIGKRADLILVDLRKPHLTPLHNVCSGLVYSARGSDVDTVIVDGKIIMEGRRVKILDEQAVQDNAAAAARRLGHHQRP